MKRMVSILLVSCFLVSCAGRTAQPVAQYQIGDEKKACEVLKTEIVQIEQGIVAKKQEKENKEGNNMAVGVVGALLFWPALFALDVSDAEKVELEALRKRHNALVELCQDKKCGYDIEIIPPFKEPEYADESSQEGDSPATSKKTAKSEPAKSPQIATQTPPQEAKPKVVIQQAAQQKPTAPEETPKVAKVKDVVGWGKARWGMTKEEIAKVYPLGNWANDGSPKCMMKEGVTIQGEKYRVTFCFERKHMSAHLRMVRLASASAETKFTLIHKLLAQKYGEASQENVRDDKSIKYLWLRPSGKIELAISDPSKPTVNCTITYVTFAGDKTNI